MSDLATTVRQPDSKELAEQISPEQAWAQKLVIHDDTVQDQAIERVKGIKELKKKVKETFDDSIKTAHQLHKQLVAKKKEFMDPLDAAEKTITDKVNQYLDWKEEEAKKRAEEEAEKQRQAQEQRLTKIRKFMERKEAECKDLSEQIDSLEAKLEDNETTDEEAHLLRNRLQMLFAQRDFKQESIEDRANTAEEIVSSPDPVSIPSGAGKAKGMVRKKEKIPTIINPKALLQAVLDEKAPITLIQWDMTVLKKLVNNGMDFPGVNITEQTKGHVR